jgi:hypothetical protein
MKPNEECLSAVGGKERPIIFSTPMVQAILDGRKTQTRRIVKLKVDSKKLKSEKEKCPYGQPGDFLWVREAYVPNYFDDGSHGYRANWNKTAAEYVSEPKWKPSIHMPKAAARIWLRVKDVRVERVQEISEADIKAEGVRIPVNGKGSNRVILELSGKNKAIEFLPKVLNTKPNQSELMFAHWAQLWCKINGRESWDANPWVWVVEFEHLVNGKESIVNSSKTNDYSTIDQIKGPENRIHENDLDKVSNIEK